MKGEKKYLSCCGPLSWVLSILLLLGSCRKDPHTTPDINKDGEVTAVGTSVGTSEQKEIGPAGGTFSTADNKLSIEVPPGALSASTTISIEPITGHCPGSTGNAFRLSPHNVTFNKPVKLTFTYTEEEFEGSSPAFMAVAFQNERKMWQTVKIVAHDTVNRKITVETNHFSDWDVFESFYLTRHFAIVSLGGEIGLAVRRSARVEIDGSTGLPFPIIDQVLKTEEAAEFIRDWRLAGAGTLTPDGPRATYVAPLEVPKRNPVAVSVRLKNLPGQTGELALVSNILVMPEDGVILRVDGGDWMYSKAPSQGTQSAAGLTWFLAPITIPPQQGGVQIMWTSARAGVNVSMNWELQGYPRFQYSSGNNDYYLHFLNAQVSPGYLKFIQYDNTPGNFVVGYFLLVEAGYKVGNSWTPHKVEGYFKIKRIS